MDLKIQNNNVKYITTSFPAFLLGGDIFQVFILIAVILVIIGAATAIYRKKKSSEKVNRRISSLRREFNTVKEESFNKSEYDWIEDRLNADDPDLDDITRTDEK